MKLYQLGLVIFVVMFVTNYIDFSFRYFIRKIRSLVVTFILYEFTFVRKTRNRFSPEINL